MYGRTRKADRYRHTVRFILGWHKDGVYYRYGENKEFTSGTKPPYTREAPVYFERNGKGYLYTSGTTGYFSNESRVALIENGMYGEYKDLGNPHPSDETRASFSSQITDVLKLPDKDVYITLADRWLSPVTKEQSRETVKRFEKYFKNYVPETAPRKSDASLRSEIPFSTRRLLRQPTCGCR